MLIVIYTPGESGSTFLDWGLHFLAGQKEHLSASGAVSDVCINPLNKKNAHGHKINASFLKQDPVFAEQVRLLSTNKTFGGFRVLHLFADRFKKDEQLFVKDFLNLDCRLVFMGSKFDIFRGENRGQRNGFFKSFNDYRRWLLDSHAGLDHHVVSTPGLAREFMAFNRHHFIKKDFTPHDSILGPNCFVTDRESLSGGAHLVMQELMRWLGLKMLDDRADPYKVVAKEWQDIIRSNDEQLKGWPLMIDAVLHGREFDCGRLTFIQEAALVHDVMVAGGGLIRAKMLERLPRNARDIHELIR